MEKPMIRHCENCKWHEHHLLDEGKCTVKYKTTFNPRKMALLCRYYKEKEVEG